MTNEPIEERLTAYALGELSEAEQETVEELLETDKDAQRMLEEIRAAAQLGREALKAQPSVALSPEQRIAIEQATASLEPERAPNGRKRITLRRLALAASFLLVFGGLSWAAWLGLGPEQAHQESSMRVAALPEDLKSDGAGENPAFGPNEEFRGAEEAKWMAEQMPGIDRYFITDINGPGRSAAIELDYSDPKVQGEIRALYEGRKAPEGAGQGDSAVVTATRPKPEPMPVAGQAEVTVSQAYAAPPAPFSDRVFTTDLELGLNGADLGESERTDEQTSFELLANASPFSHRIDSQDSGSAGQDGSHEIVAGWREPIVLSGGFRDGIGGGGGGSGLGGGGGFGGGFGGLSAGPGAASVVVP